MPAGHTPHHWRSAVMFAGLALFAAWLWLLYELSWLVAFDSDHANTVLAGRDLIGNPLLRDWVLPGDPYWLTDLHVFGIVAALVGAGPMTMHVVPVLFAAAFVATAWWALGQVGRGAGRWIGTALVTLLVGLPHPILNQYLVSNLHVATVIECLIGAALLAHHPRRPAWWIGVLLLAAAVISDPFAVTIGVLPVVCAGAAAGFRQRCWAPLMAAGAAALLAGGAAPVARLALRATGGFGLAPTLPLAPSSYRLDNLGGIPETLGALLGVGPASGLSGTAAAIRGLGATLFVLTVVVAAVRLLAAMISGPGDGPALGSSSVDPGWIDDVLFAGTFGGLATFVFVTLPPRHIGSARYLIPTLLYGALLAGRQIAWFAPRLAFRGRVAVGAGVLTLALAYLTTPVAALNDPEGTNPGRTLAPWLAANGLRAGYGPYWLASIVTVESRGSIAVRPAVAVDGKLRGYHYYSTRRWFTGPSRPGRWFVVFDPDDPTWGVDEQSARATFGQPSNTVDYDLYRILIWDHDLSPQLGPPYRDP